jgi:hypothetical protein
MRAPLFGHLQLAVHIEDGVPAAIVLNGPRPALFEGQCPAGLDDQCQAGADRGDRDQRHAGLASPRHIRLFPAQLVVTGIAQDAISYLNHLAAA